MYDEIELQKMEREEAAKILKQVITGLKEIQGICESSNCVTCPYGRLSYMDEDDGSAHYTCSIDDSCSILGADLPFEWKFYTDIEEDEND